MERGAKRAPASGEPQRPGHGLQHDRVVGRRARIGVVVPSTNTIVEYDLARLRPRDVTFHVARFHVEAPDLSSDDAFLTFLERIRTTIPLAVRDVLTCEPDHLLLGMSAETFWGGAAGSAAFEAELREQVGDLGVTSGAAACAAALERLGVRSIACLTPYQPVGDAQVHGFFTEFGYDVRRVVGLRCSSATSIAAVGPAELVDALRRLDGPDVEAIVQCGTNLSMVALADEAERWLGKPVLAINAVCLWHALRAVGLDDTFDGAGTVLREL